MTAFALRTSDEAWIARHDGVADDKGRVVVLVDDVERVDFAGREWLRHTFTDIPRDAWNGSIMCPVAWVR
jgi:hypothetical protein